MQSRPQRLFADSKKPRYNYDLETNKVILATKKGLKLSYPSHNRPKRGTGSIVGYMNNYYNNDSDKASKRFGALSFEKTGHSPPCRLIPAGWQLRDSGSHKSFKDRSVDYSDDRRAAQRIRARRDVELRDIIEDNIRLAE